MLDHPNRPRFAVVTSLCRGSGVALAVLLSHMVGASEATTANWQIETVAGTGKPGAFDPTAKLPAVDQPFGVEWGPDDALYITSVGQHRVLRLDPATRTLTSVAGNGQQGYDGDGGPAGEARLNEPYEVRFDAEGRFMYFVEMRNHAIRRVDRRSGIISTVAGNPQDGFAGDGGPAREARFRQPHSIALDEHGNLYIADIGNHRIRRIDAATGIITSIAGNGEKKLPPDGSHAKDQPILGPRALHVVDNDLWVALREGNSIWRLDLNSGTIHHVAGSGKKGYSGDGGPPRDATFNGPKGIVATPEGVVYGVDTENQVIRAIDSRSEQIATIAGAGPAARGFAIERGPALEAWLDRPHGIGIAPDGTLFIGDTNNHRVRALRPE